MQGASPDFQFSPQSRKRVFPDRMDGRCARVSCRAEIAVFLCRFSIICMWIRFEIFIKKYVGVVCVQ